MIRVGTAGWHYEDWNGIVYPRPRPRTFDPLETLARLFDTLEVNVTFYRSPDPSMTGSWVKRVSFNSAFRFTAKLPRSFTHAHAEGVPAGPRPSLDEEEARFRAAIAPLLDAGRLGAVLVQFPQSFHHTAEARGHLEDLLDRFSDLPCVAEFRHAGWGHQDAVCLLRDRRVGFCNIDQPQLASTLRPTAFVTGPVAYVRLHGRNAAEWFGGASSPARGAQAARTDPLSGAAGTPGSLGHETGRASSHEIAPPGVARRYDYLYSEQELAPWLETVARIAEQAADTFVIANNHFRGKAAVNALQIKAALEGAKVEVPEPLLAVYPRLAAIAKPMPGRLPFE